MRQNKKHGFTRADQDWIGLNFCWSGLDSDWKISQSAHLWHGQDQDWISCRILAIFLDQDWIWIFIFEKNWIRQVRMFVWFLLLQSEIPSGMCAKLRTVAASSNRDHACNLSYYCLLALHIWWCDSLGTSRSWWITLSTQHHRKGCNTITNFPESDSRCHIWWCCCFFPLLWFLYTQKIKMIFIFIKNQNDFVSLCCIHHNQKFVLLYRKYFPASWK